MKGRNPAFRFYVNDILFTEPVPLLNNRELGALVRLWGYCWLNKSLPKELPELAKIANEPLTAFRKIWPKIEPCFWENGTRLRSEMLDLQRSADDKFHADKKEAGYKGAEARYGKKYPRPSDG